MKIKIIKCIDIKKGSVEYWYRDRINEEMKVNYDTGFYYFVFYTNKDKKKCMGIVNIKDCEILK